MSDPTNIENITSGSSKKRTRPKKSWIWQHFKEEEVEKQEKKITIIKCQEMTDDDGVIEESTDNNINWIVNDSQPIRVVKSEDLRILFKELDPAFVVPSQETIRNMIYETFNYTLPKLKTLIKNEAISISLTLDLWTSRNKQGYLRVTCSFINSKWKLKELTLTIEYVCYPHTAANIRETLELVLKDWDIRDKIYAITTDNGSNVKKAINEMEEVKWLGCTAHTLHLVIGKGIMPAQILIMRAKRLINFFMRPKQSERLEEIQKKFPDIGKIKKNNDINVRGNEEEDEEICILLKKQNPGQTSDYLHIIADIITRWNSSFLAWQQLLRLKDYINVLINTLSTKTDLDFKKDYKRLRKIMLEEEEWSAIKDVILILKPFAEATNYLGGSKYCTYSVMVPTLIRIINQLQPSTIEDKRYASEIDFKNYDNIFDDEISIEDDDEEDPSPTAIRKLKINNPINTQDLVKKVKLSLYVAMKYYWSNLITPRSLLPSLLDPRIKDLSFVTAKQRQDTKELLKDEYNQEKLSELLTSNSISDSIETIQDDDDDSQKYDSIFASFNASSDTEKVDEVIDYLALKKMNFESDPLEWWHGQEKNFPILSSFAKKYLAVYVSSTSSERLFSDAGNLLTVKRNQMNLKLFQKIMFLKRNGKHMDSIHK
ncbi:zinc finger BED domain-containing protein 1-like [Rhizophagus clarus]|uniref:Zinc finger BED domain-containing protein 1-like n=1 Tax=Rhizophagus clarus TaxID=94130 RepID=A0A8H3R360_9GLOM|nr:zinc finger BED domain-containing protein 1-like [Rhizophagus clarus]